jgi:hypothetical protein
MSNDPRDVIALSPMSRLQMAVVGITIALNARSTVFDILSISFASPGIAAEWGIDSRRAGHRALDGAHRNGHSDRSCSAASPNQIGSGRRSWDAWR